MKHNLVHLAGRIFGTPLLIQQQKLEVILQVLGPRLGLAPRDVEAYGPGDPGATRQERKPYYVTEDGIAVIDVMGPLVKRESGDFLSGGPTTYTQLMGEFGDAAADSKIRGILLDIDSPGGEVGGLFQLTDMIHGARGQKPIYAVANDDAFSAAYAIACSADRLFVSKTGGVGSVGVIAAHCDQSGFDEQLGLKYTYLFDGDRKADLNPHEPITDEAKAWMVAELRRLGGMFRSMVARNRNMDVDAVRETQAGVFFGPKGVSVGFADDVGSFDDALSALRAAIPQRTNSVGMAAAVPISKEVHAMDDKTLVPAAEAPETDPVKPTDETTTTATEEEQTTAAPVTDEPEQTAPPIQDASAAADIVNICAAVGLPSARAAEFISKKLTVSQVAQALAEERAATTDANPISSLVRPETTGAESVSTLQAKAGILAQEKGITTAQAMASMFKQNPALYSQYLAENPAQTGRKA